MNHILKITTNSLCVWAIWGKRLLTEVQLKNEFYPLMKLSDSYQN